MRNSLNFIVGGVASSLSAVGTSIQTDEVLQIISLVLTILGTLITFIVLPLLNWYIKAKQDGKITIDEVKEGVETLQEGINSAQNTLGDKKKEE